MAKLDDLSGDGDPSPAGGDPHRPPVTGPPPAALVWQQGRAVGPLRRLASKEPSIYCWICGRPLRQGEDFGLWRLRAVLISSRYIFEFRCICPAHYRDGATAACCP